MSKRILFVGGMLVIALVLGLGLVLAACSDDSGKKFEGDTLAGTKWVAEIDCEPEDQVKYGTKKMRATLTFSSDTTGTYKAEVTQWASGATAEQKEKMDFSSVNGAFDSTYNNTTKTGTYELKDGTEATFTVNVGKKELTAIEDGDDENPIVYKLK